MSRSRLFAPSVFAFALAACGARSALYDQALVDGGVVTVTDGFVAPDAPMDVPMIDAPIDVPGDAPVFVSVSCPATLATIVSVRTPLAATVATNASLPLHSAWTVMQSPAPSAIAAFDPTDAASTTVTFNTAGRYLLTLEATDGVHLGRCTVEATVADATVHAVCPSPITARQTDTALLMGAGQSNADRPVRAMWTVVSAPTGSTSAPVPANSAQSRVTFDQGGEFEFQLTVSDDLGHTDSCRTRADVTPAIELRCPNEQSGFQGTTVPLVATATSNFGRMLSFGWQVLSRPTQSHSTPVPDGSLQSQLALDALGDWQLQLTATDSAGLTSRCTTRVHADPDVIAQCPTDIATRPFATEQLAAMASSRTGRPLSFRWEIVDRPVTSTASIAAPARNPTPFTFDVAGTWDFRFTATNDRGNLAYCTVRARAVSDEAVRVELVWSTAGTDIDLHLADVSRAGGRWASMAPDNSDCYYGNCKCQMPADGGLCPDGVLDFPPTGTVNNPQLDIDHTNDLPGPENINVRQAAIGTQFDVGVHFYGSGTTNVTVRVYCAGNVVFESESLPLDSGRGGADSHNLWRVGRVTTTPAGCTFERCGAPGNLGDCIKPENEWGDTTTAVDAGSAPGDASDPPAPNDF